MTESHGEERLMRLVAKREILGACIRAINTEANDDAEEVLRYGEEYFEVQRQIKSYVELLRRG